MTTSQIADKLITMMQAGESDTIYRELYTEDAKNIEPMGMAGMDKITQGTDELIAKGIRWNETFDTIESSMSAPTINDEQFIITMSMTTKNRDTGKVSYESEHVLYTTHNGKITEERFFYLESK